METRVVLGPVDIEDWEFDRRDVLSMGLRPHAIDSVARGGSRVAPGVPAHLQDVALQFARQAHIATDELERSPAPRKSPPEPRVSA